MTKNVDMFLRAPSSVANFVGTIPFRCNAATAGRIDRADGHASIGGWFSGF
ncbi:hypothetical protein LDP08_19505 [Ralstonia pseudosolanacearum]|uniref:hypothetical protein n=1 Tax=Ralstonia pseudosolanacearum TaxID=1310165 RepID=UPI003CF0A71F